MDVIYESAAGFAKLLDSKYRFIVSHKRRLHEIIVSFKAEDYRHAVGLQYLDDIVIENDPAKVLEAIFDETITDEILNGSDKYKKKLYKEGGTVEERISEMCFIEEYLNTSDFIKIYEFQTFGSWIDADYFIETTSKARQRTVYIFIRKRQEDDTYVIVSFFEKHAVFRGTAVYFMLKERIDKDVTYELYRNPSYKDN